jgi:hypothetical protein
MYLFRSSTVGGSIFGPPCGPDEKWSLMTKHDHVHITSLVETFKLALHPLKLLLVARNVRIEPDHKRVPVAK